MIHSKNKYSMNSVKMVINFNASAKDLWQEWTSPSHVKRWFGSDPNGLVFEANLDVKAMGKYSISFADSDGTSHTCKGQYHEVIEYEQLVFSWEWKSEPGHESLVKIFFKEIDSVTMMEFEHSNLNPQSLHGYNEGWRGAFEKLGNALKKEVK
jgi:uncharacterized protein YndB with AHSA1/START domain